MKFNINETVRVKLTDFGRATLIQKAENLEKMYGFRIRKHPYPKEDADGYSTWQMWKLMEDLGQYVGLGYQLPFETEIILNV